MISPIVNLGPTTLQEHHRPRNIKGMEWNCSRLGPRYDRRRTISRSKVHRSNLSSRLEGSRFTMLCGSDSSRACPAARIAYNIKCMKFNVLSNNVPVSHLRAALLWQKRAGTGSKKKSRKLPVSLWFIWKGFTGSRKPSALLICDGLYWKPVKRN